MRPSRGLLPWGRGRKFLTKTNLIYKAVQMPRKEDKGGNNAEKDLPSKCRYTEPPKVETKPGNRKPSFPLSQV